MNEAPKQPENNMNPESNPNNQNEEIASTPPEATAAPAASVAEQSSVPAPAQPTPQYLPAGSGLPDAGGLIGRAFSVANSRWHLSGGVLLGIFASVLLSGILFALAIPLMLVQPILGGIWFGVVYFVYILILQIAMFAVPRALIAPERMGYWAAFGLVFAKVVPFTIAFVLIMLVYMTGIFLLFIPGLIFFIYAQFALYSVLVEGQGGMTAILRSFHLVQGRFWALVGRSLLMMLVLWAAMIVVMIGAVIFGVAGAAMGPVGIVMFIILGALFIALYGYMFTLMFAHHTELYKAVVALKPLSTFNPASYGGVKILLYIGMALGVFAMAGMVFLNVAMYQMFDQFDSEYGYDSYDAGLYDDYDYDFDDSYLTDTYDSPSAFPGTYDTGNRIGFNSYTDGTHGFEIEYPSAWEAEENFFGTAVLFTNTAEATQTFAENISVVVQDLAATPYTLEEYRTLSEEQIVTFFDGSEIIASEAATLSGLPAWRTAFSGTEGELSLVWDQYYLVTGTEAYILTFTSETTNTGSGKADFDYAVTTFTLPTL